MQNDVKGRSTMTLQLQEPSRVAEPHEIKEYADVISRVASEGSAIVLQRDGADVAVVVPLAYFELLQEIIAREEAERLAKSIDWKELAKSSPPPQEWFDRDEPKPF
jgi:putative aminopeptidase FrvX